VLALHCELAARPPSCRRSPPTRALFVGCGFCPGLSDLYACMCRNARERIALFGVSGITHSPSCIRRYAQIATIDIVCSRRLLERPTSRQRSGKRYHTPIRRTSHLHRKQRTDTLHTQPPQHSFAESMSRIHSHGSQDATMTPNYPPHICTNAMVACLGQASSPIVGQDRAVYCPWDALYATGPPYKRQPTRL
jgi:hypothetical protein